MEYITFRGKKFEIRNEVLRLKSLGIKNLQEIESLETITYLRILNLGENKISEISGLNRFLKLEKLRLNLNRIKEIKGLENLHFLR